MNILLRCDYGQNVGMGHLKRCQVLVDVLREKEDDIFIADYRTDVNLADFLRKHQIDFQTVALSDESVHDIITFIEQQRIDLLIVDSYQLAESFEQQIKQQSKVLIFAVDDLFKKHQCDMLLNHNLHAEAEQYAGLVDDETQLFCGKSYSLMSAKNQRLREETHPLTYEYFISMGASDHNNLIPRIIDVLPEAKTVVATTSLNPNLSDLIAFCDEKAHIDLQIDHENIGLWIKKSKFALVSASTLMIESIYLNTVFLAINTVDNQSRNTRFLHSLDFPILRYTELDELVALVAKVNSQYAFYQEKVQQLSQAIGLKTHTLKYEVRNRIRLAPKSTKA